MTPLSGGPLDPHTMYYDIQRDGYLLGDHFVSSEEIRTYRTAHWDNTVLGGGVGSFADSAKAIIETRRLMALCDGCLQNPCVCEPDTPELRAKLLALWPGDPHQPIDPVDAEEFIEQRKAAGNPGTTFIVNKDGSVRKDEH